MEEIPVYTVASERGVKLEPERNARASRVALLLALWQALFIVAYAYQEYLLAEGVIGSRRIERRPR